MMTFKGLEVTLSVEKVEEFKKENKIVKWN